MYEHVLRAGAALRRWWIRLWMDEKTAYLSEANSYADLERRIRAWNNTGHRGRLPFL